MSSDLSANARAILLLTAPLLAGRNESSAAPLTPGEYRQLARRLKELQREPSDLLESDSRGLLEECQVSLDAQRVERLLGRGFLLSQAVERWRTRAIWVLIRADAEYPRHLKKRLREDAPPILYGCGEASLLNTGGLAVVGSRECERNAYRVHGERGATRRRIAAYPDLGRRPRNRSGGNAWSARRERIRSGGAWR